MSRRTLGYIVVNGDGQPLRWADGANQFFTSFYKDWPRWRTVMFDDYETARKCIAWHYQTIFNDSREYPNNYRKLQGLRIVSLNAAEVSA